MKAKTISVNNLDIYERANSSLFFLSFNNLSLSVSSKKILDNISFSISYSKIILIKGRVGSGKSTILKMLGGLLTPDSGSFIHENGGTPLNCIYINSQPEFNFITGYVKDELSFSGINDKRFFPFIYRTVYDMSGGELKKLSILIATSSKNNTVLLVDEPLDMLDDIESDSLSRFIIEESNSRPFIIAAHDNHFDDAADVIITVK